WRPCLPGAPFAVAPGGRGTVRLLPLATTALTNDEPHRKHYVEVGLPGADLREEDVEGHRAKLLHRLANRGQRRVHVTCHRHVVEAGHPDLVRHANAPAPEPMPHAPRGLGVGADDRAWQLRAGVQP